MNLPLGPDELAGRGGLGWTEMKGSWFVFATTEAHEDDCRWRAPDWHGSRVADAKSLELPSRLSLLPRHHESTLM